MLINSNRDEYFFSTEIMLLSGIYFMLEIFCRKDISFFFIMQEKVKKIINEISITLLPSSPNHNKTRLESILSDDL
jgi:hypothetical protein